VTPRSAIRSQTSRFTGLRDLLAAVDGGALIPDRPGIRPTKETDSAIPHFGFGLNCISATLAGIWLGRETSAYAAVRKSTPGGVTMWIEDVRAYTAAGTNHLRASVGGQR
jgi:hypothetical protein